MEGRKIRVEFSVKVDADGKCRLWAYRFSCGDSGEFETGRLNQPQTYIVEAELPVPAVPDAIRVKATSHSM